MKARSAPPGKGTTMRPHCSIARSRGVFLHAASDISIAAYPAGSRNNLNGLPDWIPGARRQSGAVSNCSLKGFTGAVVITQWFGRQYDGDVAC